MPKKDEGKWIWEGRFYITRICPKCTYEYLRENHIGEWCPTCDYKKKKPKKKEAIK